MKKRKKKMETQDDAEDGDSRSIKKIRPTYHDN